MSNRSWFTLFRVLVLLAVMISAHPLPAYTQGLYRIAIVVADDFGGEGLAAVDPGQVDPASTCAVSLESQAFMARGVSSDPVPGTHGDLVYSELEGLIEEVGASDFIELVQVDIQGQTTDVVAQRIASALDNTEADLYVVNMSFALIPCDLIQGFADYESQMMDARTARDLNRYRGLFQRAVIFYDDTIFPVMSQRAQSEQDLDPLQALFVARSSDVIPVASAGNFGLDYPFWPGAWGQVISASASVGEGFYAPGAWDDKKDTPLLDAETEQQGQKKRISNYGEVMMPGEYADELGLVSGTSFAAPRLSVAMALYASQVGTGYCRKSDGSPALAYGDWDNLTLNEAVQQYCPAMQAYLP